MVSLNTENYQKQPTCFPYFSVRELESGLGFWYRKL